MKTAIVMEINAGVALIMKTGGEFLTVPAQKGWQKGDVVTIAEKRRGLKVLYAAAACLAVVLLGAVLWHNLYFTQTALVSIDINPSIELSLNRFDRVIGTAAFNEDGEAVLSVAGLEGLKYDDALETLLQSDALRPYLENNEYLDITVSGSDQLERQIQDQAQGLVSPYKLRVACHSADEQLVAEAHAYGMTPGRYLAFLELKALEPDVDIEDYTSCGVGQIHKEIEAHHNQNRGGQDETTGGQGHGNTTSGGQGHGGNGHGYGASHR